MRLLGLSDWVLIVGGTLALAAHLSLMFQGA